MLDTRAFACPYCGETIELVIDTSEPELEYIEDCEVCCRPIVVRLMDSADGVAVELRGENE